MLVIADVLEDTYKRHGRLTPQIVVDEATPADAPLHSHFEWDDQKAGHAHRLDQARTLIRTVKITRITADDVHDIRKYVSVQRPNESAEARCYVAVDELTPSERRAALQEMEIDWRILRRRWSRYDEFWALVTTEAGRS